MLPVLGGALHTRSIMDSNGYGMQSDSYGCQHVVVKHRISAVYTDTSQLHLAEIVHVSIYCTAFVRYNYTCLGIHMVTLASIALVVVV